LNARTGELIALAVSESNSCYYCLAAHTFIGEQLLKQTLRFSRLRVQANLRMRKQRCITGQSTRFQKAVILTPTSMPPKPPESQMAK
jgi:alkylhydroperoxidase family enzyme